MTGQRSFTDVTVFNFFSQTHSKMTAEKCLRVNEKEKKRSYGN